MPNGASECAASVLARRSKRLVAALIPLRSSNPARPAGEGKTSLKRPGRARIATRVSRMIWRDRLLPHGADASRQETRRGGNPIQDPTGGTGRDSVSSARSTRLVNARLLPLERARMFGLLPARACPTLRLCLLGLYRIVTRFVTETIAFAPWRRVGQAQRRPTMTIIILACRDTLVRPMLTRVGYELMTKLLRLRVSPSASQKRRPYGSAYHPFRPHGVRRRNLLSRKT
jgi:hypothetical protein